MADPAARRRWIAGLAGALVAGRSGSAPASRGQTEFARHAMAMRDAAQRAGDQPYGAVVVKDGKILAAAPSRVLARGDPTAHAEMEAIREAARALGSRDLSGCHLYGSSPACRMCETAAYWAGIAKLFHGPAAEGGGAPRYAC